jgi:hypothetical protein
MLCGEKRTASVHGAVSLPSFNTAGTTTRAIAQITETIACFAPSDAIALTTVNPMTEKNKAVTGSGNAPSVIKDPTAEQAAKILGVPIEGVRRVYAANANQLYVMAGIAAVRKSKTYRGFTELYLRERAVSYSARCQ